MSFKNILLGAASRGALFAPDGVGSGGGDTSSGAAAAPAVDPAAGGGAAAAAETPPAAAAPPGDKPTEAAKPISVLGEAKTPAELAALVAETPEAKAARETAAATAAEAATAAAAEVTAAQERVAARQKETAEQRAAWTPEQKAAHDADVATLRAELARLKAEETPEQKAAREAAETPEQKTAREALEALDAEAKLAETLKSYDVLTLPEGMPIDQPAVNEFKTEAAKLGLSPEAAQGLMNSVAPHLQKALNAPYEAWADTVQKWATECANDKEFGGKDYEKNLGYAALAIDSLGDGVKLREVLISTGAGNNPEIVRWMIRAGKMLAEPTPVQGRSLNAGEDQSLADKMYPNMPAANAG